MPATRLMRNLISGSILFPGRNRQTLKQSPKPALLPGLKTGDSVYHAGVAAIIAVCGKNWLSAGCD